MDGFEPPFHGTVKYHVAGRRHDAAPDREILLDRPPLAGILHIPRAELAPVAARAWLHLYFRTDVGRAGVVVRLQALPGLAEIIVRNVEQPGARRVSRWIPVLGARRGRTDVANGA